MTVGAIKCVRGGLKYCYLMRGGGRLSGHLAFRGCASCGLPWGTGLSSVAGEGVKWTGKVEAASAARLRREAYGGTLTGVCGTPCPLHRPVVFLTSLPPFYYKLMEIG